MHRRRTTALRFGAAVLCLGLCLGTGLYLGTALCPDPAAAQSPPKPRAKSVSAQLAEQKLEIESQIARADSQSARVRGLESLVDSLSAELAAVTARLATLERDVGSAGPDSLFEERLRRIEAAGAKSPELSEGLVSAGDFPGSIRVPGLDAAIKFGGRIRTSVVLTLDPLGTDDRFLTNSIPVGQDIPGEDQRTNISARASRLNVEFRTPVGTQDVRAFFEGDFAGAGNALRLRHAYAQFMGFIVGQTWSTFSDPWADHEDLDFEGVSSENLIRQPQIRYWWNASPETRVAFAAETPLVSLTGGSGVNLVPDLIGRIYWGYKEGAHLQAATVLRQIRGETAAGDVRSDVAAGGSLSGVLPFRIHGLEDRVIFQVNGGVGIARYINDLSSLGGMDAVFDTTTGDLHALPAFGWYVAYEHTWKEWNAAEVMHLRSTILWSFVSVDNFEFQPPDAYKKTHRLAANLVFSPASKVDVGLEYIYGTRQNKDGSTGSAGQIQLVTLIHF